MEFDEAIIRFNRMYGLPVADTPTLSAQPDPVKRLENFLNILREEINEGDELLAKMRAGEISEIDILVEMADWYGDIQVYCASEMARYGLPLNLVLNIIMQSNFSKLGADGNPIYDDRGKVRKGPNFWSPEPKIKGLLETYKKD